MKIVLRLRSRDGSDLLADLSWSEGHTQILAAAETLKPELEQLILEGLSEWTGADTDPHLRITASTESQFLERLGAFLRRQFGFLVEVQRDQSLAKRVDTVQWPPRRGQPVRQAAERA
jgi:hypothetical protein